MAIRDSQDPVLPISQPTTAKIRDTQDLVLPVSQPTTAKIRVTSDLVLMITPTTFYYPQPQPFDDYVPMQAYYQGIQMGMDDGSVPQTTTKVQYQIIFSVT